MKRALRGYEKRDMVGFLYIMPWIVGFCFLQLLPFARSLMFFLTNLKVSGTGNYIGLANYIRAFTKDSLFSQSVSVTLRYLLYALPCKIVFALLIAMILNMKIRGINLFRTLYYLPSILGGSVAISALWRVMFASNGVINNMLAPLGIVGQSWLGSPKYALGTLSIIWTCGSLALRLVLFLAALKQVPNELYDAASVDGAGKKSALSSILQSL